MSDPKYDVFLSFRGEDTRDNFTSHLNAELCRQNIETFIDNRLDRGEEISLALYKAIQESTIYVIILSEHYASSSWCLDELTEILKCKERYEREVIPVFYKVHPSNVRHQRQSYADDLVKHHQRFGDKVDVWKAALNQVAGLSGWDSQKTSPESILIEKIAEDILIKLKNHHVPSDYYEGMTGMDKHVKYIQSLLDLESQDVRIIGIWGMGGIGKTTIASAVFEKLETEFSSRCCIVTNVQQEIERVGPKKVRKQYLSQLLGKDTGIDESKISIVRKLKRAKVLLVFDDVKDFDQLQYLYVTHDNFALGSRIIVTSRDMQVLLNANADAIYEITQMDDQDSLQLFCSFAFKENHPIASYVPLTKKVLHYAQGLPLALKVLGSLLYKKSKDVWESQLEKLTQFPDRKIFELLKLSYDELDKQEKEIFLDIACFYKGELKKVVELTLNICGFSAKVGMVALKDRCLITISEGKVWMHDLIQEMGHEIVRQECVNNPEKCSRLWKSDDICDVLSKNKGTDAIRCIFLDMDTIKEVRLHPETFKKMHNLRVIRFNSNYTKSKVVILPFLESLPNGLKLLYWHCFPQISLPEGFCPENLVILDMPYSDLEKLWEVDQDLPNLKRLNLRYSKKLKTVPNLSLSPNIEEVILSGCVSLTQVHSSSFLNKLNWLCLDGCISLQSVDIPSNILSRSSGLGALHGCHNLQTLSINSRTNDVVQSDGSPPINPDITVRVFDHEMLFCGVDGDFDSNCDDCDGDCNCDEGDAIWILNECEDIRKSDELCWLDVSNCESLTCLPAELLNLKFLTRLSLSGCLKLEELPEIKEPVKNLEVLILDKTAIKELPSSLHRLAGLQDLSLESCTKLKTIPPSIENLSKLLVLNLAYCESLEIFPDSIFKMLRLQILNFQGCSMLRNFPIPNDIGQFSSLTKLSLQETGIVNLPESIALLSRLRSLNLSDCKWLECIPKLPPQLEKLLAFDCPSIKIVGKNSRLKLTTDSTTYTLKFHLTNTQQLDENSWCNIGNEAMIMCMSVYFAYYSVIFCFPGSAIPSWFHYSCQGHSVIMNTCDPYWWGKNLLVGFALCAVLEHEGMDDTTTEKRTELRYTIRFESNGQTHSLPDENSCFFNSEVRKKSFAHDHTFIWMYKFTLGVLDKVLHAHNFTIEIKATDYYLEWVRDEEDGYFLRETWKPNSQSTVKVKECGICPLFSPI